MTDAELGNKLDRLTVLVESMTRTVEKLDEVVRTGNGKPALVTKVSVLEARQNNDEANRRSDMKIFGGLITVISGAIAVLGQVVGVQ